MDVNDDGILGQSYNTALCSDLFSFSFFFFLHLSYMLRDPCNFGWPLLFLTAQCYSRSHSECHCQYQETSCLRPTNWH